jgi:hypothetical protein
LFHGFKGLNPHEILFERSEESFCATVSFGLPKENHFVESALLFALSVQKYLIFDVKNGIIQVP